MSVTIRPGRPDDADAIAMLARELNIHVGFGSRGFEAEDVRRDVFGADPAFHVLVAENEGELIGYAALHSTYETGRGARGMFLADLHIAAGNRGLGVGRMLMQAAAAHARDEGGRFLWWVTDQDNMAARAFYRRFGAVEEASIEFSVFDEALDALADGREK